MKQSLKVLERTIQVLKEKINEIQCYSSFSEELRQNLALNMTGIINEFEKLKSKKSAKSKYIKIDFGHYLESFKWDDESEKNEKISFDQLLGEIELVTGKKLNSDNLFIRLIDSYGDGSARVMFSRKENKGE